MVWGVDEDRSAHSDSSSAAVDAVVGDSRSSIKRVKTCGASASAGPAACLIASSTCLVFGRSERAVGLSWVLETC